MIMWENVFGLKLSSFLVIILLVHHHGLLVTSKTSSPWLTLSGDAPAIIARGGFSGLFPDSSSNAYTFALITSSPDTTLWCDVQLSKDGIGFCLPDVKLNNCTNINFVFPNEEKEYLVNGINTTGWFSVDYDSATLSNDVFLVQDIYSRSDVFDSSMFLLTVESVPKLLGPPAPALWLNIQHDIFYTQHNLSMRNYVISLSKRVIFNYISSPEVGFLNSIARYFKKTNVKFVFRFLEKSLIEPSTNQTYGSLLKNLTFIKSFASGILVPKQYIWPVTSDLYLEEHTSIVMDAHKEGLEIYAGGFANDGDISYNYSFNPVAEQLSFVDNGVFSVDGVVTDYPITASEAVGCFSHINKSSLDHGKPIIISHNGASGDYPECTDLAYQKAVDDGADIIDCPVQVTSDGVLICMSSINLLLDTTVTKSSFSTRTSFIPDIQGSPGIFTFNLTWQEIQKTLKPQIANPETKYRLVRNPRYANAGNFTTLSDFLNFAKGKDLSGVLISIDNAEFMVEKLGFDVTNAVIGALNTSGYNNQSSLGVTIMSGNSSVLLKFRQQTNYSLIYMIDETIRDVVNTSITDIKKFADAVAINKDSIYPSSQKFITKQDNVVDPLQKGGLSVYVYTLQNEFVSQDWDFFSDPIVEINTFVLGAGVDGVITDFPGTARAYKRNSCTKLGVDAPNYMRPVQIGGLMQEIPAPAQPPTLAPFPLLEPSDVVEAALPPVSKPSSLTPHTVQSTPPSPQPSTGSRCIGSAMISIFFALVAVVIL